MKTIIDLINEINANGGIIDTSIENVCYMQDCIGHSSVGELHEISNGIHKELFYRIYGIAEGTVEAIKFHCKNSDKLLSIIERNNELENDYAGSQVMVEQLKQQRNRLEDEAVKHINEKEELRRTIKKQDQEIIELKAKLFDLMNK